MLLLDSSSCMTLKSNLKFIENCQNIDVTAYLVANECCEQPCDLASFICSIPDLWFFLLLLQSSVLYLDNFLLIIPLLSLFVNNCIFLNCLAVLIFKITFFGLNRVLVESDVSSDVTFRFWWPQHQWVACNIVQCSMCGLRLCHICKTAPWIASVACQSSLVGAISKREH
jgi:hypothetical protein